MERIPYSHRHSGEAMAYEAGVEKTKGSGTVNAYNSLPDILPLPFLTPGEHLGRENALLADFPHICRGSACRQAKHGLEIHNAFLPSCKWRPRKSH